MATKGLDLSTHNGNVDFNLLKQNGIDFVILRLGWVGNKENHTIDSKFETYYNSAKSVGLKVGCYVYSYVETSNAMKSAINWVKNKIQGKSFEYPIFLDLEDEQISYIDKKSMTNLAIQFCQSFENSGIYANKNWFTNKLDINQLLNYKIWLAEWNKTNYTVDFRVDIWQYTSDGTISGISGRVDMNYSYIDVSSSDNSNSNDVGGDFDMPKTWRNGSTDEPVYQDLACTQKIGTIYPREYADCYGIKDGKYIVCYFVTNSKGEVTNRKLGFVKYNGGL